MSDLYSINEFLEKLKPQNSFEVDIDSLTAKYQDKENENSTIFVKILTVLGGILAALAFIGFLLVAGLYDSRNGLLFFGTSLIILAIWISRSYNKLLLDTFSISAFAIGFIMIGLSLNHFKVGDNSLCFIFIVLSVCAMLLSKNYMMDFISVLIIGGSFLSLTVINNQYNLIHAYIWVLAVVLTYLFLKEAKIVTRYKVISKSYNPIRIGLTFSFIISLAVLGKSNIFQLQPQYIWMSSIVTISVFVYLVSFVLSLLKIEKIRHKAAVYFLCFVLILPTSFSPGISGALIVILLSFFVNYKTGLLLGIIAFIYFISQYYYDLRFTLLEKSGLLFLSGILFTIIYFITRATLNANDKNQVDSNSN